MGSIRAGRGADRDGGRRNGTVTSHNGELLHNLPYDMPHHGYYHHGNSAPSCCRNFPFASTPTVAKTCSTPPMLVSGVSGAARPPADPMSVATWPGDMATTVKPCAWCGETAKQHRMLTRVKVYRASGGEGFISVSICGPHSPLASSVSV